jgi:hypothetical protein
MTLRTCPVIRVFKSGVLKTCTGGKAYQNKEKTSEMEKCLTSSLRNQEWHAGASGRFRFMPDGSTERPMVFKTITPEGFE